MRRAAPGWGKPRRAGWCISPRAGRVEGSWAGRLAMSCARNRAAQSGADRQGAGQKGYKERASALGRGPHTMLPACPTRL